MDMLGGRRKGGGGRRKGEVRGEGSATWICKEEGGRGKGRTELF